MELKKKINVIIFLNTELRNIIRIHLSNNFDLLMQKGFELFAKTDGSMQKGLHDDSMWETKELTSIPSKSPFLNLPQNSNPSMNYIPSSGSHAHLFGLRAA